MFWFRIGSYLKTKKVWIILPLIELYYRHLAIKYGIDLRLGTKIGQGLCFAHLGSIVVNPCCQIGNNCLIFQGATIGAILRNGKSFIPIIGDNVVIFAGAKIIGGVHIGNNVVIGANAVVNKDVKDGEVVAGIPAKVISNKGFEIAKEYYSCM